MALTQTSLRIMKLLYADQTNSQFVLQTNEGTRENYALCESAF